MPDLIKIVNHPLFNFAFFIIIRQLTKQFGLDDVANVGFLRAMYVIAQASVVVLSYWLIAVVRKKNDQTTLRYVEPAQQNWDGTESSEQLVNTTNMEYDVKEIQKGIKQSLTGIGMIAFLHLQFKFVQPLLVQSILCFKTFFTSKEARIHIFGGKTSSGELRRPFRLEAPFGLMSESRQPKTDKGSIKRATKARKAD